MWRPSGLIANGGMSANLSGRSVLNGASLLALALVVAMALFAALLGTEVARAESFSGSPAIEAGMPTLEDEPEAKLTGGAEAGPGDKFGQSVALSADGKTALVGAPRANALAGAAAVFTRTASGWVQQGSELQGPTGSEVEACTSPGDNGEGEDAVEEPKECRFGRSVALSSDGNTALAGAPLARGHMGAVWIFTRSGTSWSLSQVLSDPHPEYKSHFGAGVALSADGKHAIVGAPADDFYRGGAWIFARSVSGWSQQGASITGGGEVGQGRFGQNVALSAAGTTALIGAPSDAGPGAAWVFHASGTEWVEVPGKLTDAGLGSGANFGGSVALSGDGETALIGARSSAENTGAAFVFAQAGGTWSEQAGPFTGSGEAGEEFGYSVALSTDGEKALIGASGHEGDIGAAWLFEDSGGKWAPQEQLEAGLSGSVGARFGSSVALASDAQTILIGGRRESQAGAAWVFGSGPSVSALTPNRGGLEGGTAVTITGNNLTDASTVRFGGAPAASFTVLSKHTIAAITPPGEGAVAVTVTTPFGTSSGGPLFTYARGKSGQGAPPPETPVTGGGAPGTSTTTPLGGVLGFSSTTCAVRLLSKRILVQPRGRAGVRLQVSGTRTCAGKLRLRVTRRLAKHKVAVKTIGTAIFSIAAGRTGLVSVKLNAAGRRMFGAHKGRLSASLLLVRSSPAPVLAQVSRVRLARASKRRAAHA